MVLLQSSMTDPFEIIVGTYEQFLLGYKVENVIDEYKVERTFATHSHTASVRTVTSNKHYLASGGADDSIYLYDMRNRIESGRLMHHNDTVNCIAFTPEASHLFTCSNDGTISAIRCGNWQIEKHWLKAHKGFAVNSIAIHPTGKIALSTGADGILRTWNLVKGRQAYATNLVPRLKLDAKNVTVLKWSPNGEKYLLAVNQRIDIYSVELAGIDDEIKFDSKIVCVEFLKDNLIAVGLETGQIKFYDLDKCEQTLEAVAHDIRVKCIASRDDLLVTCSSSGEIKLWRYTKHKLDVLQTVSCGARITCISLANLCKNMKEIDGIKTEGSVVVKEKKKFRLRQEVVIEDEDDWEVTAAHSSTKSKKKRNLEGQTETNTPQTKKTKMASKPKRKMGWTVEDTMTVEENPKKKKKSKAHETNNISINKRKEASDPVTKNFSSKKLKGSVDKSKVSKTISPNDKKALKVEVSPASKDTSPKLKRTLSQDVGTSMKKKKKKQRNNME